MQSEIASPVDGKIEKILVKERAPVKEGDLLMTITGAEIKAPSQVNFTATKRRRTTEKSYRKNFTRSSGNDYGYKSAGSMTM